jgi:hypothetical protein
MSSRPPYRDPLRPWSMACRTASRTARSRDWAHRTLGSRRLASGRRASRLWAATRCTHLCSGRPAWPDPLVCSTLPAAAETGPSAMRCPQPAGQPARSRSPAWCGPPYPLTAPQQSAPERGVCARSRCTPPPDPYPPDPFDNRRSPRDRNCRTGSRALRGVPWSSPGGQPAGHRGGTSRGAFRRDTPAFRPAAFKLTRGGPGRRALRLRPTRRAGPARRRCRRPRPTDG